MKDALLLALARLSDSVLLLRPDYAARRLALSTIAAQIEDPAKLATVERLQAKAADEWNENDPEHPWNAREAVTVTDEGVAIVTVSGVIAKGFSALVAWWFGFARVEAIEAAIDEIANRTDITAVVFRFDSPGGYTTGVEEAAEDIAALSAAVPTFAYTDTLCCSAAYWLASQCTAGIAASRSSDVGCVGTYMAMYDYAGWLEQQGIKLHMIRAGDMKGIGVFGKELTEEEQAFLQAEVDAINAKFLAAVHSGRETAGAEAIASEDLQGQWFSGEAALGKNLVDVNARSLGAFLSTLGATLAEDDTEEEDTAQDEIIEDEVDDSDEGDDSEAADGAEDGTAEDDEESATETDDEEDK